MTYGSDEVVEKAVDITSHSIIHFYLPNEGFSSKDVAANLGSQGVCSGNNPFGTNQINNRLKLKRRKHKIKIHYSQESKARWGGAKLSIVK